MIKQKYLKIKITNIKDKENANVELR